MSDPATWKRPEYPTFFQLGEAYQEGVKLHATLSERLNGAMGMTPEDAGILAQVVCLGGHGHHLEIGSLFGGTAILAALIKDFFDRNGLVHCVDDLEMAGQDYITPNAEALGVRDQIILKVAKSHPLPFSGIRFQTVLIDASHDYGSVLQDWFNVREIADKYVIFHDYDPQHEGVVRAANEALLDPHWFPVHVSNHSMVLEKG